MRKNVKKKKKNSIIFILILLIIAVIFSLRILTQNSLSTVVTETVMTGSAEDKVEVSGYIIRDEFIVNAPDSGIISFRSDEGKRISKGSSVAVVYTGEVSDEVKNELSSIHERINEIEGSSAEKNLYAGDSVVGTSQVINDIDSIVKAVYTRDTSAVPQYKDDITRLIRNDKADGKTSLTTLEQLEVRRRELENSISGSSVAIYAPVSGVLCSKLDGYEDYFNISCLDNISPSYLDECPSNADTYSEDAQKDSPCLKITDNYEWYFAANVDEKWASDIKVGAEISIRLTDISEDKIDGTVYKISEPSDGVSTVVIKSSGMFSGMYTARNVKAEIIRRTYRGFKVTKDVIHIDDDGTYYVYINSEGIVRRRNVNILYSDASYAIIEEDNSAENNLLLYDEVIVSGNNIKEGGSL